MKKRSVIRWIIGMLFVIIATSSVSKATNQTSETETNEKEKQNKTESDYIKETADEVDYKEIQDMLDEIMPEEEQFDFKQSVMNLVSGEEPLSFTKIATSIKEAIGAEFSRNKTSVFQLIAVAIIAAIFTNFANVFNNNQVAETGFYVTYLFLFSILTASFYYATQIAVDVLNVMIGFMKVLVPTYMLSIAFSAGARTSMIYYESTLMVISIVDLILIKIVIPLVNVYFVLVLANNLSKEDMLSKLGEFVEMIIRWILKTMMALVIGFNAIQGLIIPMADHVKNSLLIKSTSAIPGIGNTINSVTETILGASVVVKNAIGVTGLIVILGICAIPLLKLAFYVIIYKFGAAIVQPVSDKRVICCINAATNSARLLLSTVFIAIVLFMVSIAIIAASTNLKV